VIDFTLPVNASNILLQFITGNTSKNIHKEGRGERPRGEKQHLKQKKEKDTCKIENISQVLGIDSVITALPKAIAAKLGVVTGKDG
jgi:hypothetical protein